MPFTWRMRNKVGEQLSTGHVVGMKWEIIFKVSWEDVHGGDNEKIKENFGRIDWKSEASFESKFFNLINTLPFLLAFFILLS